MKRFLVTGGTGFIGSAAVRRLLHDGHEVRILDDDSRGNIGRLDDLRGQFEFIMGDVRNPADVLRAVSRTDIVLHLAAVNGTRFFYSEPERVLEVAVKGMINVLDACRKKHVSEIITASSSEVYQVPPYVPTDELVGLSIPDPTNPRYSYAGGKLISELLTINYGRTDFDRALIFRPHNVYGPAMGWEHVVPEVALRLMRTPDSPDGTVQCPIQGTGEESRAYIYIDDFVDGLMTVIDKGQHLNIYNIGTDVELRVADLVRTIGDVMGRAVTVVAGQLLAGSTLRRWPNVDKLKALGFIPRVSLRNGLESTVAWYGGALKRREVPEGV